MNVKLFVKKNQLYTPGCISVSLPEKYKRQSNPLTYELNADVDVRIEATVKDSNCSSSPIYLWYYTRLSGYTKYNLSDGCFDYKLVPSGMFNYGKSNILVIPKSDELLVGHLVLSIVVYGTNISDSIFATGNRPKSKLQKAPNGFSGRIELSNKGLKD